MAYLRNHLMLTIQWQPANMIGESAQCSLRVDNPLASPSQSLVDACVTPVKTFWQNAGSNISSDQTLMKLRLARIGTDGRYVPDSSSFDAFVNGAIGSGGGSPFYGNPLQVACAATLLTAVPHGQASKGRIFLPPIASATQSNYLWTAAQVNARTVTLAAMLTSLQTALGGPVSVFSRGTVKSNVGLVRSVTAVKIGQRPDVQRRRARQLRETYGNVVNTQGG